jgi:Ser/Thr protein kinase RdoA (MazF antagonist)
MRAIVIASDDLTGIAGRFKPPGEITQIREYGNGNVNDTFLVSLDSGRESKFVLQRINRRIFRQPQLILRNMRTLSDHVQKNLQLDSMSPGRRWEVPRLLSTPDGLDHFIDHEGSFWRAMTFIDSARSCELIEDVEHAREIGYALGIFQHLISDLPPQNLADTLEDFHITPHYLKHYDEVIAKHQPQQSVEVRHCVAFISERRKCAHVLEEAKREGKLPLRPIHGDPKINNILLDESTRKAVSMVDLDTVKPGLVHYDIGDCLRSGCNPMGEETQEWETVRFELDFCRAILQGYLVRAKTFLTDDDYDYLYDSIRLIAFELGLRFFTDYLQGNIYFKAGHREHNLTRALVQFQLTASIESQAAAIRTIIREMR